MPTYEAGYTRAVVQLSKNHLLAAEEESIYRRSNDIFPGSRQTAASGNWRTFADVRADVCFRRNSAGYATATIKSPYPIAVEE